MIIIKKPGINGYVDCSRLFSKGQTIERWHGKITRELTAVAKVQAPISKGNDPRRTPGRLKNSIGGRPPIRTGTFSLESRVRASAPYARFVHEGTTGPIFPKKSRFLTVPPGAVGAGWLEHQLSGANGRNPLRITRRKAWVLQPSKTTALRNPEAKGFFLVESVRGQKSQPFLEEAIRIVGARHRWRVGRGRIGGRGAGDVI